MQKLQRDIDKLMKRSEKLQASVIKIWKRKCLLTGHGNTSMNYEMYGTNILNKTVKKMTYE